MTYIASPSYDRNDPSRASNLRQCLETARRRLDETSHASETEKIETLVASAIEAGWEDDEVRDALSPGDEQETKCGNRNHLSRLSVWFPRHLSNDSRWYGSPVLIRGRMIARHREEADDVLHVTIGFHR
ncbi:hypothetical protein [Rhizobium leguminosarum]|uniref:hypothetical protein n=3 Tax=Rhizobium leguminosarum TaxID=384 RepID=UPI001FDEDDFF|nr:hypothetical protein [Rhizobium leguminosarum]WSH74562.1 hypothetical protein U8Q02_26420 [Rhizobium leguminosarum]